MSRRSRFPRPITAAVALCAVSGSFLLASPALAADDSDPLIRSGDDWTVAEVPGGYEVTKRLDEPLDVRSDLPTLWTGGEELGTATVSLDGETLSLTTADPAAANADTIEQGWAGAGDPQAPTVPRDATDTEPAPDALDAAVLADDPADVGPYSVERYDYDLGDEAIDLRDLGGRRGEMRAAVFLPGEAKGERPVALFLHGRHTSCAGGEPNPDAWPCGPGQVDIPSYLGYNDAAETLASNGYAVVSISANAVNALDGSLAADTGAAARGALVLDHLDLLRAANAGTAPDGVSPKLAGRLDLTDVGLMGHSRGGEGIMRAAAMNSELDEPFGIRGLLPLAPTDYTRVTVPGIPTAAVLPYCDGDVEDQMGQKYIDDARHAFGDDVLRSSVLVMGANHNFFNTYWTPSKYDIATSDDWSIMDPEQADPICGAGAQTRLDADEQYAAGNAYIAGFFRLTLGDESEFLPMFDGSDALPASAAHADVRVSATVPASSRFDVDNFTDPDTDFQLSGAGDYAICESLKPLTVPGTLPYCVESLGFAQAPDWSTLGANGKAGSVPSTRAMHLTYDEPNRNQSPAQLSVPVPGGSVDTTGFEKLSFRVSPDEYVTDAAALTVALVDGAGGSSSVDASDFGDALSVLPGTTDPLRKVLLQQIEIPVVAFTDVDATDIRQVRITAPGEAGGVLLSDLAFIHDASIGTVETSTRPLASVPDIRIEEGDSTGSADVPVLLSRPAEEAATVYLSALGSATGKVAAVMQRVDFAPGEICRAVTVPIQGDGAASTATNSSYVTNVSNTQGGATIGDAFGALDIREDDGVTDPEGAAIDAAPEVGAQGDACDEALAERGELSVSPSTTLPGETVTVTGTGFRSGEAVDLVLHSDTVEIGTLVTDGESFTFETTIPSDADLGEHSIVATGHGSGRVADAAVLVADTDAPNDDADDDTNEPSDPDGDDGGATDGGSDTPGEGGDDGTTGADDTVTDDALAVTGAEIMSWLIPAGALLVVGGLVLIRRRRMVRQKG